MRSRLPMRLFCKGLFTTPGLIPFILKGLYRKHIAADRDFNRGTGKVSKPPFQLSLRITNRCNHRCAVCAQYGEKGYMHRGDIDKSMLQNELSLDRYKKLVDECAWFKPLYYLTGGEISLYKGIVELCNYMKQKGSRVSVVTNGNRLKENAEAMVDGGWDMVLVSLDGPEDIHDECRGMKGAYKAASEGIKTLQEIKRKKGKALPYVMTSTTISPTSAPYLERTFDTIADLMPDVAILYLSWFTTNEIGEAYDRIIEREFGVKGYAWQGYLNSFSQVDTESLLDQLKNTLGKKWPFEHYVIPNLDIEDIPRYFQEPTEMFGYSKCIANYIMLDIMPNGDVVTCRDFIDVKVGNINESSVMDIWNGEKLVKWRKLLIDSGGTLPICARCCGLMGY